MSAPRKTLEDWQPRPAERRLATGMGAGLVVEIGQDVPPDPPPPERVIRASFLRALILGQIEGCPVHEKGVRVRGAFIEGDGPEGGETRGLDLEGCEVRHDLGLFACRLPEKLLLRSASLRTLNLHGTHLEAGLTANRPEAKGSVFLSGIEAFDGVRPIGAADCGRRWLHAPRPHIDKARLWYLTFAQIADFAARSSNWRC